MSTLPLYVLRYGRDEPPPRRLTLRAGPLDVTYESGDLRAIRLGAVEVVQRIYAAVRDRNWGTVPMTIADEQVERGEDWFRISYHATHRQGPVDFSWDATISGDEQGTIRFTFDGVAGSTFLRNRIGLCALHPGAAAGAACAVTHGDGTVERATLPALVAPHQPFFDIRAVAHEATPGVWAHVTFEGDVFEMEDQRNWTDDSFKTYSTPLALPFPVEVAAGTRVSQSVTLRLEGWDSGGWQLAYAGVDSRSAEVTIGAEPSAARMPPLGLCLAESPLDEHALRRLLALRPAFLRADLRLADPAHLDVLLVAYEAAARLGCELDLALHVGDEADLHDLAARAAALRPPVRSWLAFPTDAKSTTERCARAAREALDRRSLGATLGGGSDFYFTELNRASPPLAALDFLSFALNPQVHAFDELSVVENLAGQSAALASARSLARGLPVAVSPVTLRPRANPDATDADEVPTGALPPSVDPRQMSLFAAAWTVGSLARLAAGGSASVTFYETHGWRGVQLTAADAGLPPPFAGLAGAVFPVYHVLADACALCGAPLLPLTPDDPRSLAGLALRTDGRTVVLLANLTAEPRRVRLVGLSGRASVRLLDEVSAGAAMRTPEEWRAVPGREVPERGAALEVELGPYAVAQVEGRA